MNNVGKIFDLIVYMFAIVICSGCASAWYSTEADSQIAFDKEKWLTIYLGDEPSIKDKKLGLLLGRLMADEGFVVSGFNYDRSKNPLWRYF